jgi:pyruvate formate lyase activating enzyme
LFIAGLQKNSFIDFPGKISCVLFLTGCNFICPYCHNPELARGEYPQQIPFSEMIDFLSKRQGLLEGVTITGGEPTLERGLAELCQSIKALGYPVKLDTNGSRPDTLGRLLDQNLLDFVAMDIKAPLDAYQPFSRHPHTKARLTESIRWIMDHAPAYEFRTTCVRPFISAEAIKSIARTIEGATHYVLQPFNPRATCLDPEFGQDQDPTILPETMQQLKEFAEPFVLRCTIR